MLTTWQFRIKDSIAKKKLKPMARAVNFVWNFAKATQVQALERKDARIITDKTSGQPVAIPNFLSAFELNNLTSGSGRELGLHSQTVQAVCEEYVTRRKQFGKLLRWRGKKSLGWIPFKRVGVKVGKDSVVYAKRRFRFWNSRELPEDAVIKTGSFTEDRRGRWYVSITFESKILEWQFLGKRSSAPKEIGIDLGIKILATTSLGEKVERPDLRSRQMVSLRKLERQRRFARRLQSRLNQFSALPKDRQFRNLHAKVANQRKDDLHKKSSKLVRDSKVIILGDLRCAFLNRSKTLSGISLDSGLGMFKQMLRYKSVRDGVTFKEVSERDSTQTCSSCGWKHPPQARIGLGVREWTCPCCHDHHDRDVNAARNILRMGHHALTHSAA